MGISWSGPTRQENNRYPRAIVNEFLFLHPLICGNPNKNMTRAQVRNSVPDSLGGQVIRTSMIDVRERAWQNHFSQKMFFIFVGKNRDPRPKSNWRNTIA